MSTKSSIVVTPELSNEAGAIVFWDLAGVTDMEALAQSFTRHKIPEDRLPMMPSPETALRRAVEEACGGTTFKRKARSLGVWVIVAQRENEKNVDFDVEIDVGIDALGRLKMEPPTGAKQDVIRAEYDRQISGIPAEALSSHLCHTVAKLDGVALRLAGGFYFIPKKHVPAWNALRDALREANAACALRSIPAMHAADVIDAVTAAIVRESEAVAAELSGTAIKSERGRAAQIDACNATIEKVARYEGLLGTKLETLREKLENLRFKAATAMLESASEK
jgi:hypothetical protein